MTHGPEPNPVAPIELDVEFAVNDTPSSVLGFLFRTREMFAGTRRPWRLDLTNCPYLGPDAAVIIVAALLDARSEGREASVVLPKGNVPLEAFCEFSGLRHYVAGSPIPAQDHPDNVTIPIQVSKAASFRDADAILNLTRRFVNLDTDTEDYLRICVNEVQQNVEDHAESRIGCVTAARVLKNVGELRVAIADRGRGIGTTLRSRHPDVRSTGEALKRVLEGGYSAKSRANNMGVGISNLTSIVTQQLGGELFIVSEDAYADARSGQRTRHGPLRLRFPGTCVFFTMRVK